MKQLVKCEVEVKNEYGDELYQPPQSAKKRVRKAKDKEEKLLIPKE